MFTPEITIIQPLNILYIFILSFVVFFRNKKNKINPDDRHANPLNDPYHPLNNPGQQQQQQRQQQQPAGQEIDPPQGDRNPLT